MIRRPRFIAEHSRHARGCLGRAIATVMSIETAQDNARAIDLLAINPADTVLDIGTGHGRSLALIATRINSGVVCGIDTSELMVSIARRRNRQLIAAGRVRVERASSSAIAFPDATFDKILSVHTLYFWDPLQPHLREMFRVLKPGGRLMLVFRPAEDVTVTAAFPAEIYRFRTLEDVCAEFGDVGLDILAVERREAPGNALIWLLGERPAVKLPDHG